MKPNVKEEKYCVNCVHHVTKFFRPNRCEVILKKDEVTAESLEIFNKEVRVARILHCKGDWYEHEPVY